MTTDIYGNPVESYSDRRQPGNDATALDTFSGSTSGSGRSSPAPRTSHELSPAEKFANILDIAACAYEYNASHASILAPILLESRTQALDKDANTKPFYDLVNQISKHLCYANGDSKDSSTPTFTFAADLLADICTWGKTLNPKSFTQNDADALQNKFNATFSKHSALLSSTEFSAWKALVESVKAAVRGLKNLVSSVLNRKKSKQSDQSDESAKPAQRTLKERAQVPTSAAKKAQKLQGTARSLNLTGLFRLASPVDGSPQRPGVRLASPVDGSPQRPGVRLASPVDGSPQRPGVRLASPVDGSPQKTGTRLTSL